ncbi:MAG: hypothetical protein WCK84_10960 [Bacteroidota bacterium]
MKTISKTLVTAFFITFIASTIYAQNNANVKDSTTPSLTTTTTRGKFVDNNKDGVCDNFEARGQSGRDANFVDKNGDGVCDNRGTMGKGNGRGNGSGQGYHHRHGQGKGQGNCYGGGKGRCRGNQL